MADPQPDDEDRMIVACTVCGLDWDMDYEPCPCDCDEDAQWRLANTVETEP